MKVIGFDPGSHKTGYCILDDGRLVEAGVMNLGKADDLSARLGNLLDDVTIMVCHHEPHVVGVESPFVGRFASAVIPLAGARGVILAACSNGIIKVTSISPTEVKVSTGASRRAEKSIIQALMREAFGLTELPGEDCADAMAIALATYRRETAPKTAEPSPSKPPRARRSRPQPPASPGPDPRSRLTEASARKGRRGLGSRRARKKA